MSASPRVTAFIPVYNRERYISVAIESILAQSFTDFELLIIDDGSTDRSREVVESYIDPRVRLVCNDENLGTPKTRNKGLQLARGEYIALLDSDDYAYPDRLKKQVAFLDSHPDYAEVGSWCTMMDEWGRPLRELKIRPVSPPDLRVKLLFACPLKNRTIMARVAICREYGYRNDLLRCQDYDLHLRLSKRYKLGNLPEILACGRRHPNQLTQQMALLGESKKREIVCSQLSELNVAFSDTDLQRHRLLPGRNARRLHLNDTYLDWAEEWLLKLQAANHRVGCYPEPSFTQALGRMWCLVCWYASSAGGLGAAWRRFRQSPMSRAARSNLTKPVFTLHRTAALRYFAHICSRRAIPTPVATPHAS